MTIYDQIVDFLKPKELGTIIKKEEIRNSLNKVNNNSLTTADYCYNRKNKGITFTSGKKVFEFISDGEYRYIGENAPYTGYVHAIDSSNNTYNITDYWYNGKLFHNYNDFSKCLKNHLVFEVGSIVTNSDIVNNMNVGNMGDMRRSVKNNSLVLISDFTKGLYADRWENDILYYTGMGKTGDQDINKPQNSTLFMSNYNNIHVHLFEVMEPTKYMYSGLVSLVEEPRQEIQKGDDGNDRRVWIFPLKILNNLSHVPYKYLENKTKQMRKQARELTDKQLFDKISQRKPRKTVKTTTENEYYERDEFVKEFTKRRANGICQLCGELAPFKDKQGDYYLESHHVKWLSNGGEDSIYNTVALCPNCHTKIHIRKDKNDENKLKQILNNYQR